MNLQRIHLDEHDTWKNLDKELLEESAKQTTGKISIRNSWKNSKLKLPKDFLEGTPGRILDVSQS